jgi:Fe-S cluster biogenesis protein NfuA
VVECARDDRDLMSRVGVVVEDGQRSGTDEQAGVAVAPRRRRTPGLVVSHLDGAHPAGAHPDHSPVADLSSDVAGDPSPPGVVGPAVDETRLLEVLEVIRPALQADGGDLVYHGVDGDGVVSVELVGACGTCPVSTDTMKAGIERILRDRVAGVTEVVQVGLEV